MLGPNHFKVSCSPRELSQVSDDFRHVAYKERHLLQIVNGLVLASDGQKMSKRKKNYPDPLVVVNSYGADALRLYLINSPGNHPRIILARSPY